MPMTQLAKLKLAGNQFTSFPNLALPALEVLDLSNNQLSGFEPNTLSFDGLPSLTHLVTAGNLAMGCVANVPSGVTVCGHSACPTDGNTSNCTNTTYVDCQDSAGWGDQWNTYTCSSITASDCNDGNNGVCDACCVCIGAPGCNCGESRRRRLLQGGGGGGERRLLQGEGTYELTCRPCPDGLTTSVAGGLGVAACNITLPPPPPPPPTTTPVPPTPPEAPVCQCLEPLWREFWDPTLPCPTR